MIIRVIIRWLVTSQALLWDAPCQIWVYNQAWPKLLAKVVGLFFSFLLTDKNELHHTPYLTWEVLRNVDFRMTLSSILASHGVILANKHVFWKHFCHWDYIITSCGFDISLICKRNRPPCNLFSRWFSTNVIFQSRSQIWFSWFQRNSSAQNNLCQALHIRAPAYLHSPSSVHHKGLQRLTGSHSSPKVHTRPASCCPLCSRRTHSRHNPLLAGRPCELLM